MSTLQSKVLYCHDCDYVIESKSHRQAKACLLNHVKVKHLNRIAFTGICDFCGIQATSQYGTNDVKSHLFEHIARLHLGCTKDEGRELSCFDCGDKFSATKNVACHYKAKHSNDKNKNDKESVVLTCDICEKSWKSESGTKERAYITFHILKNHLKTKKKAPRIQCFECNMELRNNRTDVFNHWIRKHNQRIAEAYQCFDCEWKFLKKSDTTKHIRVAHRNDRDSVCDLCGKNFLKSALLMHILGTHFKLLKRAEGIKSHCFDCFDCGARFHEKYHLQLHMTQSHYDVGKVTCDECSKICSRKCSLILHFFKVHVLNGYKLAKSSNSTTDIRLTYSCFHCDFKCTSNNAKSLRRSLYNHLKRCKESSGFLKK